MKSNNSPLVVNGDQNVNNSHNVPVVSSVDFHPLADDNENTTQNPKDKNRWCCFHMQLPVTGKLEKRTLTLIFLIFLVDGLANFGLFCATHEWWFLRGKPLNYVTWSDVRDGLGSFHTGTVDTLLLYAIRVLSMFLLSAVAIAKGAPSDLYEKGTSKCCCIFAFCKRKHHAHGHEHDAKLLPHGIGDANSIEGIDDRRKLQPIFETVDDSELYEARKKAAIAWKYSILLVMFLLCTGYQGYIGVKCVTFDFLSNAGTWRYEVQQAIFYGTAIVCINIEIFALKSFVDAALDFGESIVIKSLHPHPLTQRKKLKFWCDLCRARAAFCTYRCESCNFDVCQSCEKKERKRLKSQQEEKLRLRQRNAQQSMKHGGNLASNINLAAASESYTYANAAVKPGDDPTKALAQEMTSATYLKRALTLFRPHSGLIAVAFTCLLLNGLANLLLPSSQGRILDQIVDDDKSEFVYQIKKFLVLSVMVGLFGAIKNLCFTFISRRLTVSIRSHMFDNLIVQNIEFYDDMSTGELLSRMTNDVNGLMTPLRTMLSSTLSNVMYICGGLAMCFATSWRLSMLSFATVAPVLFITGQYAKWSRNIQRAIWAAFGSSTQIASQAFSNIRTVRAFGTEHKEVDNFDNALQEVLERGLLGAIGSTITFTLTNYLDLGANVLILYFGGVAILDESKSHTELTIGKLITFQLYWIMINNAYQGLQNVLTAFIRGAGAAERVLTLLDRISDTQHNLYSGRKPSSQPPILDGHIWIENISFHYKTRADTPVLNGLSLHVQPGQVVALVGKSGGGKSTLIHLLMRFYDVTSGAILYNDERIPLTDMNLTFLRKRIGFVAQDTQLFDCTIKENIIYGVDDERDREPTMAEVVHFAKLANCHEFIDQFEEQYNTRVGERGVRLSGGQKQRLAIARMLMKRPNVLFLDEATSNLDTQSEALVQAAIDKTIWDAQSHSHEEKYSDDAGDEDGDDASLSFKANAVVLVAHRLSTVINADQIAVVDNGRIAEIGSHDQLLQIDNGIYKKLVERQIQRENNQLNEENLKDTDEDTAKASTKKSKAADDIDSLFDN